MIRFACLATLLLTQCFCHADDHETIQWTFSGTLPGQVVGSASIVSGSLQSPVYPGFPSETSVLKMEAPSWIRIPDTPDESRFDFDNGDAVTFEAWVRINSIGENVYLIGKGRTGTTGQKAVNQNWAFRLRKSDGASCVNFLFRSRKTDDHPGNWHRWTSTTGISTGSRWHH
ncbi:MAG: hypothetical protein GY758_03795, partial [Fuerstiella sp.]|nr:hypothetical protein [Fuerstiella sp.]